MMGRGHECGFRLTHAATGLSVAIRTGYRRPKPDDFALARRWLSSIVRHAERAGQGTPPVLGGTFGSQVRSYHFVFGVGVRDMRTGHRETDADAVVWEGKIDGFIRANVMGGAGR